MPWRKVNIQLEEGLIDLLIQVLALDVQRAEMPGAPGAIKSDSAMIINLTIRVASNKKGYSFGNHDKYKKK